MTSKQTVRCIWRARDRYGRILGLCKAGTFILNEQMVKEGWAFAEHQYTDVFDDAEAEAMSRNVGIWEGYCDRPDAWREGYRPPELRKKPNASAD
jgi:endonuclease YncB( thermonuclease family)